MKGNWDTSICSGSEEEHDRVGGVVVSHLLCMQKASGSIPDQSIFCPISNRTSLSAAVGNAKR